MLSVRRRPQREPDERGREQEDAVEVGVELELPARAQGRRSQRPSAVTAEVAVDDVVARPERLIRGDGYDERAAGLRDPAELAQGAPVVGGVLDHVETGDDVEAVV